MKIRNGWVGNSSSSSFVIVGKTLNFEGETISYDQFYDDYLSDVIFGRWHDYYVGHEERNPINHFVSDSEYVKSFPDHHILPLECKNNYKKLVDILKNKPSLRDRDLYTAHIRKENDIKQKIVKYISELVKPLFDGKDINLYTASDNSYTHVGDIDMCEESYVYELYRECDCELKFYFNNH